MVKRIVFLLLLSGFLLLGLSGCKKKEFEIAGFWNIYWDGNPTPLRYKFSGTSVSGTVLEVEVLPSVQFHTYAVDGSQITIIFHTVHGVAWSRSTCNGVINEEEESMEGTYSGQSGGTPTDPVHDFSGTWSAMKIQ